MKSVQILMSTYNGEKYIKEQIDSLLNQIGVEVKILVRDDGSTDNTQLILEHFRQQEKLVYYIGENIGWKRSFMKLVCDAPESEFYAFCDQDDHWLPDKLISALNQLIKMENGCNLYCSDTYYWKEGEEPFRDNPDKTIASKVDMLIWTMTQGCTFVFNRRLLDIVRHNPPSFPVPHDGWFLKVAGLLGNVYFDETPHIWYRQHGDNCCGSTKGFKDNWKRRLASIYYTSSLSLEAKELLRCYSKEMPEDSKDLCQVIATYRNDFVNYLRLLFSSKFTSSSSKLTSFGFKFRVLLRKI